MRTAEIAAWVNEREAIRMRKAVLAARGQTCNDPWPENEGAWGKGYWTLDYLTDDEILRKFRFCNVRREDDRVTTWIRQHIIERWPDHEHLWLMLAIARTINWPPTLQELIRANDGHGTWAWPSSNGFRPSFMAAVLEDRKRRGEKIYTGAYMIRAPSSPSEGWFTWGKQRYIAEVVIGKLWKDRESWSEVLRPFKVYLGHGDFREDSPTSEEVWRTFQNSKYTGWGPFMAYQVVVDLQHTRYLREAPDVQTWAAAGPGTLRGLNRWMGYAPDSRLDQEEAMKWLLDLRKQLNSIGSPMASWVGELDLSDVCNICCEWDKYERVRLGEGRPRALYVPGRGY